MDNALVAAIFRLVWPLARLLLRYGIPMSLTVNVVKQVYVEVAWQEFGLPGRKQTTSRVAILTGLSRKEVARLRRLQRWDDHEVIQQYNRAARVISAWVRDTEFHDACGQPALSLLKAIIDLSASWFDGTAEICPYARSLTSYCALALSHNWATGACASWPDPTLIAS
jgi:hypothetical protein